MSMIKQLRLKKGLSQEEMAKKLDISVNAYRNYELGERLMPISVVIKFLRLRAYQQDLELVEILEELCPKEK